MSDLRNAPTQQLYRQWRGGDADAGQAMAQRFSDWYYAVTASRLGDSHGRVPLQRSCTRFQQGIVSVAKESELVGWAHGILTEELTTAGGRIPGGDFPSPLTNGRAPFELLAAARAALPEAEVRLLAHAYDSTYPIEDVRNEAEEQGGMPLAVLRARYALKRWLCDNENVSFTELPAEPNLDFAPLPLYEAGRMQNAAEETNFEKWLLSNMALCKDIAEFGVFALALRAGAFRADRPAQKAAAAASAAAASTGSAGSSATQAKPQGGSSKALIVVVVGVLVLLAIAGGVAVLAGATLLG